MILANEVSCENEIILFIIRLIGYNSTRTHKLLSKSSFS